MFTSTRNKKPSNISIGDFLNYICGERWRILAQAHRRYLSQGRKHDAQTIKGGMECIIPSGTCHNGHAKSNLVSLSELLCVDLDHTDERTPEIIAKARLLPYVVGAFVSISGNGVKLMIRVDIDEPRQYPALYEATARLVSQELNFANDGQCKDITHACYGSYDPEAYYNPEALPVNGFLPQEALVAPSDTRNTPSPAPWTYDHTERTEQAIESRPVASTSLHPRTPGKISAAAFAQSSLILYPAVEGDRHGTAFRLSCEGWKRGINPDELANELVRLMEEDTFRETEIRQIVKSAYRYKEQLMPPENATKLPSNYPNCLMEVSEREKALREDKNASQEDEIVSGEELREHTPTFPDEIYDFIPSIFKECVQIAKDKREKDGLLLSSITTVSSMLPAVTTRYNRRKYHPNLYCMIIAPSGNSKGIFAYGQHLHKHYGEYWEKLNKKAEQEYETALQEHTIATQKARKSQSPTTPLPPAPKEPRLQFPQIPPDTSRAKLITHLINNQPCSSLLTSTEISSVCAARNQDYGHFDDIFCKVFEHESVSSSYKINGQRPLRADHPTMSVFFTGTPSSLPLLIPNTETGYFARFLINTFSQPPLWQDVFAEEDVPVEEIFDRLSTRFCNMALFLKDSPTEVILTDEQKKEFNEVFSALLQEAELMGNDDLQSVVKRYGVMTARLCSIFAAIDKATMRMDTPLIYCPDPYFKASLAITTCCYEHSKLLISSLKSSADEVKPLQAPNRMQQLLSHLPQTFTTEMAVHLGEEMNCSANAIYKLLGKAIKNKIIKRLAHGTYSQNTH